MTEQFFTELFSANYNKFLNAARKGAGEAAEDAVQIAAAHAWAQHEDIADEDIDADKFVAFLCWACKHRGKDIKKAERAAKRGGGASHCTIEEGLVSGSTSDPADVMSLDDQIEAILFHGGLAASVLVKMLAGENAREIAASLGESYHKVCRTIYSIRREFAA